MAQAQRDPSPPVEEMGLMREHHLARRVVNPEQIWLDFLEPTIGQSDVTTWLTNMIYCTHTNRNILTYMMNVNLGTFVIISANTATTGEQQQQERYTNARLWQLVVDSWVAGGGAPNNLRWLGVRQIINTVTVPFILREFNGSHEHWLDVPNNSQLREGNLFFKSARRIASELTGRNNGTRITIRTLLYNQTIPGDEDSLYHNVMCLTTDTDNLADLQQVLARLEQDRQARAAAAAAAAANNGGDDVVLFRGIKAKKGIKRANMLG